MTRQKEDRAIAHKSLGFFGHHRAGVARRIRRLLRAHTEALRENERRGHEPRSLDLVD